MAHSNLTARGHLVKKSPLYYIQRQIIDAQNDLQVYHPRSLDWVQRSNHASEILVPWLVSVAPDLKHYVEEVLNAPLELRRMWSTIRNHVNLPKAQLEAFDHQLTLDDILRESLTGEVVSKVVTQFLMDHNPDLRSNGRSDYPDIYLGTLDYSDVPVFQRKRKAGDEYGASLKGSELRPVRVPDGLEIKTCRDRIAVDCHHPHAGLHLVLLFTQESKRFYAEDVLVAFLKMGDYRETTRNTTATTVKYSFNGDRFISLIGETKSPV